MGSTINNFPTEIAKLIKKYRNKKGVIIPLLQDVQDLYGYVPKEAVSMIAKALAIHPVDIFGILSFYSQFYMYPRGKNILKVCLGTACHVMGSAEILDYFSKELNIKEGETSKDKAFTLEKVMCLGCCGMAPVVAVNNSFHGRCEIGKADEILKRVTAGGKE